MAVFAQLYGDFFTSIYLADFPTSHLSFHGIISFFNHHFRTLVKFPMENTPSVWLKQCHKPPLIWEWFIAPIYGDLGDGLFLF